MDLKASTHRHLENKFGSKELELKKLLCECK